VVNYQQDNWSEYLPIVDFAAATLPQDSIRCSPFFAEKGFDPRMSFYWISNVPEVITDDTQRAHNMVDIMQQVWEKARSSMKVAQGRQKEQANKRRKKDNFKLHD
jgi:hypothetical protein